MDKPLVQTVQETVENHHLLDTTEQDHPIVLMVSGGADSVALVRMYRDGVFGDRPAVVVHLNHLLREGAAQEDEAFVARLCDLYGIECVSKRVDVAQRAEKTKENVEVVGRCERYALANKVLATLCDSAGVPFENGRILTAHTASDRVETFLMRLIVGGGTGAFSSISRMRDNIIRPMLDCTGEEVREYLTDCGQPWREDVTNEDTNYLRSYVRLKVVPSFKERNPRFEEVLCRSMDIIAEEEDLLDELTANSMVDVIMEKSEGETLALGTQPLTAMPRALAKRVLRKAIIETFPRAYRVEAFHIDEILDSALRGERSASDITGGLHVRIKDGLIEITKIDPSQGKRFLRKQQGGNSLEHQ